MIHLAEMFGANPDYLVDVHTEITKLDEQGFAHRPRLRGFQLARMDHEFKAVESGTLYSNSLTVGTERFLGSIVNPLIRALAFDEARGRAWIKHNIEEVGNFEAFLPQLHAAEASPMQIATGKVIDGKVVLEGGAWPHPRGYSCGCTIARR